MTEESGAAEARARILIALSVTAETRLPLDIYRYLLGEAPPELIGLFVEEPALLAHAGSRLAREVVLSGLERRLEPRSLERQLRARSSALRRMFEAEGARLGLEHAFETVREERRTAFERAARRADALVVEAGAAKDALAVWSAARPPAPLRALMLTPERWPRSGVIVAVIDEEDLAAEPGRADSTLEAALRLARRTGTALTVLLLGKPGRAAQEALRRRASRTAVRLDTLAALGEAGIEPAALCARASHASILLLPPAASADARLVAQLIQRLHGAVVLRRERRES